MRGKLLNQWIGLLCLATTVALSLACGSGSDVEEAASIPSRDTFNDPLPDEIKSSFKPIIGGKLKIGYESGNTTYRLPDGTSTAFATFDIEALKSFNDSLNTDTARQERNDTLGSNIFIDSFSMMDTEVTIGMFTKFLNAIGKNSDELTSAGDGEISSFPNVNSIYKPIMQDVNSCGVLRYEFGELQNDIITEFSGFYIEYGVTKPSIEYIDPYISMQKARSNTEGAQTTSFEVIATKRYYPMAYVSQDDAKEFCKWLGPQYRLPTWQEFQWAGKGGTGGPDLYQFPTSTGGLWDSNGHFLANFQYSSSTTVGAREVRSTGGANPYGLYDLAGNLYEWTYFKAEDETEGATIPYDPYRFIVGGSFKTKNPIYLASWFRMARGTSGLWADDLGFRVVFDTNRGNSVSLLESDL